MESGNTDKTTMHLANDNPTENYDWQLSDRDKLAVLAHVSHFFLTCQMFKGSVYSEINSFINSTPTLSSS